MSSVFPESLKKGFIKAEVTQEGNHRTIVVDSDNMLVVWIIIGIFVFLLALIIIFSIVNGGSTVFVENANA